MEKITLSSDQPEWHCHGVWNPYSRQDQSSKPKSVSTENIQKLRKIESSDPTQALRLHILKSRLCNFDVGSIGTTEQPFICHRLQHNIVQETDQTKPEQSKMKSLETCPLTDQPPIIISDTLVLDLTKSFDHHLKMCKSPSILIKMHVNVFWSKRNKKNRLLKFNFC